MDKSREFSLVKHTNNKKLTFRRRKKANQLSFYLNKLGDSFENSLNILWKSCERMKQAWIRKKKYPIKRIITAFDFVLSKKGKTDSCVKSKRKIITLGLVVSTVVANFIIKLENVRKSKKKIHTPFKQEVMVLKYMLRYPSAHTRSTSKWFDLVLSKKSCVFNV